MDDGTVRSTCGVVVQRSYCPLPKVFRQLAINYDSSICRYASLPALKAINVQKDSQKKTNGVANPIVLGKSGEDGWTPAGPERG